MLIIFILLQSAPVNFHAKSIFYSKRNRVVTLVDSAFVQSENTVLYADSIIYWVGDKKLRAYHGFKLVIGKKDTLFGDSLFYNLQTQRGLSFESKTKVEKGIVYGKKFYRTDKNEVIIKSAWFTTCTDTPPHYFFYSPRMRVVENDMAVASPVIFEIMGIPTFALPFWYFPVTKKRKSGFLMPRIGRQSQDGLYIRNLSYYWAINNYSDLTATLDLIENRGVRFALSFPYNVYKKLEGNLDFTYAQEFSPQKVRWSLDGNHNQKLGKNGRIVARISFVSDKTYIFDYSEDKKQWIQSELVSYLSYSRRWKTFSATAVLEERRDLIRNTQTRTLPKITANTLPYTIGILQISNSFTAVGGWDTQDTVYRWVMDGRTSAASPVTVLKYFKLTPSLSVTTTLFDRDTSGTPLRFRAVPSFKTGLTTVLYGLSKFGVGPVKKFLQTIRPSLSYNVTPDIDQGWISAFRGYGPINGVQSASFSVSNEYQAKVVSGDRETKVNFLTTSLSFSYNFKKLDKRLSPITLSGQLFPGRPVNFRGNVYYDYYTGEWKNLTLTTEVKISKRVSISEDTLEHRRTWSIRLSHTYQKDPYRSHLSLSLSGPLTKHWRISYSTGYDFKRKKVIDQQLNLERDLHCFRASFRWSTFGDVWLYDFRIWITALPDIKLQRATLEALLP